MSCKTVIILLSSGICTSHHNYRSHTDTCVAHNGATKILLSGGLVRGKGSEPGPFVV